MLTVTLDDKDFDCNGFVYVKSIANAVLDAMGGKVKRLELYPAWPKFIGPPSPFPVQYEIERYPILKQRAVWEKIDAAVAARHLRPIDSTTTADRERYDFVDAVVPFDEVVLWGKTIGYYSFQRANATGDADKVAADETAVKVSLGGTTAIQKTPKELRAIAADSAKGAKREILEHWDAIVRIHGPDADAAQVARHLKQQRDATDKTPSRKTIHNRLGELRRAKLIP